MDNNELAAKIASDLFRVGSEPSRGDAGMVHRIEFKGGKYPDKETSMGGLCESALARQISESLDRHPPVED